MPEALSWLHPVGGTIAVGCLVWVGSQGFRARHRARYAPAARATHRAWAGWLFGGVLTIAVAGTVSVATLRADLTVGGSKHFWVMWGVTALLTGGLVTSRWLPGHPTARRLHPWLGLGAMLGALGGAALGLSLLP